MGTYEQAFKDHRYLWDTYGSAHDMTGGYVDQGDLNRLLRKPTKATAKECLEDQIMYWFLVGPDNGSDNCHEFLQYAIDTDPKVREIARRYGYSSFNPDDEEE